MQMIPCWENVLLLTWFWHRMKTRKCVTEANEWENGGKWSVYFTINLKPLLFIGSCLEMSRFLFFLVPYPFKIEASLQNSLRLQCTCLRILDISQCLKCLQCQSGSRVSKNTANDVDHTAISTKEMLAHIFLKTTTYHRVKHCWTAEEKEHHLNPKKRSKDFFSYQSAHLVCRSQREQVETCKHRRWCRRIRSRFHLSSPADTEREPAELWQPKKREKKKSGRTGFQYRFVRSRGCLKQVWVKVLTQPEGET